MLRLLLKIEPCSFNLEIYYFLGRSPPQFLEGMHTKTADRSDSPKDDDLTSDPLFETENLLAQEHVPLKKQHSFNRAHCFSWAAQSLFFLFSLTILHQALFIRRTSPAKCAQKHSLFCKQQERRHSHLLMPANVSISTAPALAIVDDEYEIWRFNGTFRNGSPYKGPPSASVDAAWNHISDGA